LCAANGCAALGIARPKQSKRGSGFSDARLKDGVLERWPFQTPPTVSRQGAAGCAWRRGHAVDAQHSADVQRRRRPSRAEARGRARSVPGPLFDRSIDIRISRIRRKIEPNPDKPEAVRIVRGIGHICDPK